MLFKDQRLKKDTDIKKVLKKGKYVSDKYYTLRYIKTKTEFTRFAIIISAKVSKLAVIRNRLRRQIKESLRSKHHQVQPGYDIVIIVRKTLIGRNFNEISFDLYSLLIKSKLLYEE